MPFVGQFHGHDGGHSEIGPVRQAGNEARREQSPVVRGQGGAEIAHEDKPAERQQDAFQRKAPRQRQHRRAETDAQCIGRYQMSRARDAYPKASCHIGQDSHHDELGNSQPERAECQSY